MVSVSDLQAYLRRVAALQYTTVALPGLSLYFHPSDDLTFFNYAVPDGDWALDLDAALARMRAECAVRSRTPRFEFILEYAPGLGAVLRGAGFVEEARQPLMVCTAQRFCVVEPVPGLAIDELDGDAPVGELQAFLGVQQRGFGGAGVAKDVAHPLGDQALQEQVFALGHVGFLLWVDGLGGSVTQIG